MPTTQMNIRIDADLLSAVDSRARTDGLSRTKWIEQVLRAALELPQEPVEPAPSGKRAAGKRAQETPTGPAAPGGRKQTDVERHLHKPGTEVDRYHLQGQLMVVYACECGVELAPRRA